MSSGGDTPEPGNTGHGTPPRPHEMAHEEKSGAVETVTPAPVAVEAPEVEGHKTELPRPIEVNVSVGLNTLYVAGKYEIDDYIVTITATKRLDEPVTKWNIKFEAPRMVRATAWTARWIARDIEELKAELAKLADTVNLDRSVYNQIAKGYDRYDDILDVEISIVSIVKR